MVLFSSLAISDAFMDQKKYEMSLSTIKKTLTYHSLESISPEIISAAYTRIGRLFFVKPDLIEKSYVIEYLSKAIQINPKNHEAYNYRAFVYITQNDFDKALADYGQVFEIDPQNAPSYSDRGYLYAVMGQFEKGLSDLNHAIELEPDNAMFYNNRAVIYSNINDFDNALSDFNQSILLDSENPVLFINRGITYEFRRGHF